jgi:hypothetical protein
MTNQPLRLDSNRLSELDRDGRHLAHTVFRSEEGPDVAAITIKSHAKVTSADGETTFFFDVNEYSFGFRWTDKQGIPRFVRYAGNSDFIKISFDINQAAIINSAHFHFGLHGKLDGVPPGYLTKEALMSLMARDDILGISSATLENPAGVLHLLWLDPYSPFGRKVGPDNDGDRMIELKIYPEAIGCRWISPEGEVRYMLTSGDEISIAAIHKNTLQELDMVISLALGLDLPLD